MGETDAELGEGHQRHLPGEELVQQLPDRRGVAGTVDAARLDDRAGQAFADQPLRHLVGLPLGFLVGGGEVLGRVLVGLVDDAAVGVAEDADGGDVDDLRDPRLQRRAEDPFGAADVGLAHRRALGGGNSDLVDGGRVDDGVATLDAAADRPFVAEVADDQLAPQLGQLRALLRIADEGRDLVAAGAQLARDLAADEAGCTRHEDLHRTHTNRPEAALTMNLSVRFEKRQPE